MTQKIKSQLLFLGTGGSMGIPIIGCHCPVCTSSLSYNKRLRPSVFLKIEHQKILVDAGQDYRTQALHHHIDSLDGVVFTHAHYDHTAGIDDLRVYYMKEKAPLPCLLSQATADDLILRYNYIFDKTTTSKTLLPKFDLQILKEERGVVDFLGLQVKFMTYQQCGMPVNGFRFGNLAYVSDISKYPETIFEDLNGLDHLVLSALRHEQSPMHLTINEAVAFAERVGAKHTWFTHIAHEVDHEKVNGSLPPNIRLAYDGLIIDFEAERSN